MTKSPIAAPEARARLVVTLPFRPSRLEDELGSVAPDGAPALTDTQEAFNYIARRSTDCLVVITPFIDLAGMEWAIRLFSVSQAKTKILILRDRSRLADYPNEAARLRSLLTELLEYRARHPETDRPLPIETFHASVAYVGSANMLKSSLEVALECGFIVEGPAVFQVADLVAAILKVARSTSSR
jgi:hypothetical protein